VSSGICPVIADFARQHDVPYNRLYRRFHGTPLKFDLVSGNRRFSDVEGKAICRYLDRLDKLGLPAQRELLRGAADYILLVNWTPASPDEKPPSVGQHWISRFLERHPEYTLKRQKFLIWSVSEQNPTRTCRHDPLPAAIIQMF
jgi:hypothetical protein